MLNKKSSNSYVTNGIISVLIYYATMVQLIQIYDDIAGLVNLISSLSRYYEGTLQSYNFMHRIIQVSLYFIYKQDDERVW